jgi:tetratricopeptide (TPR) repeat protein
MHSIYMKVIRLGLLLAVVTLGALLVTAADLPEVFIAKYNEAVREFRSENYDKALTILDQAEKVSPAQPDATNLRGAIYLRKRDYPKAQQTFEKALATEPGSYYPKFNLAEILFLQKKYPEAREKFESLLPQIPQNLIRQEAPLVRYKILLTHLQQDNFTAAQEIADRFSPEGETPAYYFSKAALAAKHGQPAEMETDIRLAREKYAPALNQRFTVSLQELKFVPTAAPAPALTPATSGTGSMVGPVSPTPSVVAKAATAPAPTAEWARLSPEKMTPAKPAEVQTATVKTAPPVPVVESTVRVETPAPVVSPVLDEPKPIVTNKMEIRQEPAATTASALPTPAPADVMARFSAKFNEAMKQFTTRDYAGTVKLLDEADVILPRQAGVANLRGVIFVKQKDLGAADAEFDKALDYDPNLWKARLNKGELSFARKNYPEARQRYQALLEQTTAINQDFERDYLRYRILLTQLMDGQVAAVKDTIRGFDYSSNTPWQHFSAAALEYFQGHPKEAESWIVSAERIYDPVKNQVFAQSLSEMGWVTGKSDGSEKIVAAPVPNAEVVANEPQAMPVPVAASEVKMVDEVSIPVPSISLKNSEAPTIASVATAAPAPRIDAEPEWKDNADLIAQVKTGFMWFAVLMTFLVVFRFIYAWFRRSELFQASIPSIDPLDVTLRQTRPALAGMGPSSVPTPRRDPEFTRTKAPVSVLTTSAMATETPSPATSKPASSSTSTFGAVAKTPAPVLPAQIPPVPAVEINRKSYAAPNKKFELRMTDSTEVSALTAATMKATPSVQGTIPVVESHPVLATPPPVAVPVFPPMVQSEAASVPSPVPPAPVEVAFPEPVASLPPVVNAPLPPFPAQPTPVVPAPTFFEAKVAPPVPAAPSVTPSPLFSPETLLGLAMPPRVPSPAAVASAPPAPASSSGFTPAGPVPIPSAPPAAPDVSNLWTPPQILVPTVRHGFGIARAYLTADFQIAALRMMRVTGEVSTLSPTFELISRLPEPPAVHRGYVELAPLKAFEPSVLALASDVQAVVHLAPSSESLSISADFVSLQPLAHSPLPAFEMHDVSRRAPELGAAPGLYFQIAAVDLNAQFEVNSVLLYRLYDAGMMMAMTRPFDITSIQLGTDFRLSSVRLGRTASGRRSVLTGAGSQSTPPAPGSIEFLVAALQVSDRFEVESLLLNPHRSA